MGSCRRFFAFLRAINVGDRRLTNAELIEPFVRLGLADVAAYQAAGNITFRSDDASSVTPARLEAVLAEAYGFEPIVFLRTRDELGAVARARPFTDAELAGTDGRVQVSFLREPPADEAVTEMHELIPPDDRVRVDGREWYWLPLTEISASRLPVAAVEKLVGPMTVRSHGTVTRIVDRFGR